MNTTSTSYEDTNSGPSEPPLTRNIAVELKNAITSTYSSSKHESSDIGAPRARKIRADTNDSESESNTGERLILSVI